MIRHPALDRAARLGVRLGLDKVRTFLTVLGEPHLCAPAVHVAGTNGKGSVCSFVTQILIRAGLRVGTTLSPHVQQLNERVQIDGQPVGDAELTELLEHIERARRQWAADAGLDEQSLTYFEMAICAAFLGFARNAVDVQVVEVGLGGRLDATNVVSPVVCAVPHIGLDHQAILGDSLGQIAAEKAGIFEAGVPVVLGPVVPEAKQVLLRAAQQLDCPVWAPPTLRKEVRRDGTVRLYTPLGSVGPLRLGLQGAHQASNALVALGVAHRLREAGFPLSDEAIEEGLRHATAPCRLERIVAGVVLDGAHNPDGAKVLATWLAKQPAVSHRTLLFGMGSERDPVALVQPLVDHVDAIVTTRCSHPRARDPEDLADALRDVHADVRAGGAIEQALPEVMEQSDETVVTGSLFVAGAARSLLSSTEEVR
ncbi:MAG: bifunctional folylpolyglutamate synthase/dihydrofolate synthase [Myxococcales bacterium]|nr:bifunctional folylpolyglutamate synthase/dihydrofolate synthase [Myxococcales bacterium]